MASNICNGGKNPFQRHECHYHFPFRLASHYAGRGIVYDHNIVIQSAKDYRDDNEYRHARFGDISDNIDYSFAAPPAKLRKIQSNLDGLAVDIVPN